MGVAAIIIAAAALGVAAWSALSARLSARSSDRSAEEARKIRLDNLGPQVFIDNPEPMRERWSVSPLGDSQRFPPGVANPGTSFESPGNDEVRLLVGATLMITNQGSSSVWISIHGAHRIDSPEVLNTEEADRLLQAGGALPETRLPGDGIALEPGKPRRVLVRAGPTLREWIDTGDRPYSVRIEAYTEPEGVHQVWELTLRAPLLTGVPFNASRFDVLAHTLIEAQLVQLPRRYP